MKLIFEDGTWTDYISGGIVPSKPLPVKFKPLFDSDIAMLESDVITLTDELNKFINQNA